MTETMHIGIDYTSAVHQGAGIGRYTRGLVHALSEIDHDNRYTLLVAGQITNNKYQIPNPNFRLKFIPLSHRYMTILWQRLRLPIPVETFTGRLDLFHSPDFTLPPSLCRHLLLTVHDLSYLRYPEGAFPNQRDFLMHAVPRSVARASHILADSANTRIDLIELMRVDPGRISVLYPGVEDCFRPVTDEKALAAVRARYHLPPRFILHVGTLEPRKNLPRLIEAYARLQNSRLEMGDWGLVLAGGKGWLYEGIFEIVARLGLKEKVHFPGFIDDADLPALYSLADLFVYPSIYEGFGLPPLEAMACGTPVVASETSSLPEVIGEAGLLVPPTNVEALAAAIARALTDSTLRAELRERGFAQARKFDWHSSAKRLLERYRSCGA